MARTTHTPSAGQAVIELTFITTLILLVVTCAVALISTVKKEMKHDFLRAKENFNKGLSPSLDDSSPLSKNLVFFDREPINKIVEKMKDEGWGEDKRLKAPEGLLIMFSKEEKKMSVIKSKSGTLGVLL